VADTIRVDTSPTKAVLVSSLTRDASLEACVFDLIDNAIDAAREHSLADRSEDLDSTGLPSDYSDYRIELFVNGDEVRVVDNCGGMSLADLAERNLRFGKQSIHAFGIGLYGVGLNRAIFKLGEDIVIRTENEREAAVLSFKRSEYLADETDWTLHAERSEKSGRIGTVVSITNLDPTITQMTADRGWQKEIQAEIGDRYSIFLSKGLAIQVNGTDTEATLVGIRRGGPFPPLSKSFKLSGKTKVYIEAGQHNLHRFTAEPDYDAATNRKIADQYGWSIICNDRVIVMLDTSPKTGWDKKWHNEFSGFVGYVHFVSENPSELPWNTPKTDIDVNNPNYRDVLDDMRSFTDNWRLNANQAKKAKKAGVPLTAPAPAAKKGTPASSDPGAGSSTPAANPPKPPPTKRPSPTTLGTVLPEDIDEKHCKDKLLQLVHEAKGLQVFTHPYSSLALMRMLFESSARTFLIRHKEYENCKASSIPEREKGIGRPLNAQEKAQFVANMDEMISFFQSTPTAWQHGAGPHLAQSLNAFSKLKPKMNSAIHQPFQVISVPEVVSIRDELLPLFRHLLEE